MHKAIAPTHCSPSVVLTQPWPRVQGIAERLQRGGWNPIILASSALETEPYRDEVTAVRRALFAASLDDPCWDLVVFVSPGAVSAFCAADDLAGWPAQIAVAAVGPGTAEALAHAGLPAGVDCRLPTETADGRFDAAALLATLSHAPIAAKRILVVAGAATRTDWVAEIGQRLGAKAAAQLRLLTAYRSSVRRPEAHAVAGLQSLCERRLPWAGVVTLAASAESLVALMANRPPQDQAWMRAQPILTIHPRLERALAELGFQSIQRIGPGAAALEAALSSVKLKWLES